LEAAPLLRQHDGFTLDPDALADDRVVRLFDGPPRDGPVSEG
jgi:hypothetical protein